MPSVISELLVAESASDLSVFCSCGKSVHVTVPYTSIEIVGTPQIAQIRHALSFAHFAVPPTTE